YRSPEVRNGQIVVARLGDEVTVKRYRLKGSQVWLQPENPDFQPIVLEASSADLVLEGVVVGVIRNAFPTAVPA
ncbi:MAG: LexA family protein, partial [Gammaproteobacteria bacterium]